MSMREAIESMIDSLSASVPHSQNEYTGEDGFLHCGICHKAVQTRVVEPTLGINSIVRCRCACKNEIDLFLERQKQEEVERRRQICFSQTNMKSWNFNNDDRKNPKISDAMKNYVKNFSDFKKEGKGLLLYGNVGTGKTYLAACVANALIDADYCVKMSNFKELTSKIQGIDSNFQEVVDSLNRYTLLIIDDLGAERKSEYMQEMVWNVIDARYRSGLPMIITTNLTAEELKKPQDISYSRIYDRILERCFPIEVPGVSRRRQNLKDTFFDVKEKLGL